MTYGNLKSEIDNTPVLSMFKSITNNISSGSSDEDFMQATLNLNNAQIIDVNTAYVIVPATETLNYTGVPLTIPVPISATITVNTSAGAYTNVDASARFIIAIGSDWSNEFMSSGCGNLSTPGVPIYNPGFLETESGATLADVVNPHVHSLPITINGSNLDGGIYDNALALVLSNGSDLTDGHADNTLTVTVVYYIHTL